MEEKADVTLFVQFHIVNVDSHHQNYKKAGVSIVADSLALVDVDVILLYQSIHLRAKLTVLGIGNEDRIINTTGTTDTITADDSIRNVAVANLILILITFTFVLIVQYSGFLRRRDHGMILKPWGWRCSWNMPSGGEHWRFDFAKGNLNFCVDGGCYCSHYYIWLNSFSMHIYSLNGIR